MQRPEAPRRKDRKWGHELGWFGGRNVVEADTLVIPDFDHDFEQLNEVFVDLRMNRGVLCKTMSDNADSYNDC